MPITFCGDQVAGWVRRRPPTGRVARQSNVPSPASWLLLVSAGWGASRSLAWTSYQAMAASRLTEVVQFRQKLLLWPNVPESLAAMRERGISPVQLIKLCELLLLDGRLSLEEVVDLERCILNHVDACGHWM